MRHRPRLAPTLLPSLQLRVKRLENHNLGIQLVRHPVPPVLRVVVDLKHFVGDRREDLVDGEEVGIFVDGGRVQVRHGEVAAGAVQEGFPYTV